MLNADLVENVFWLIAKPVFYADPALREHVSSGTTLSLPVCNSWRYVGAGVSMSPSQKKHAIHILVRVQGANRIRLFTVPLRVRVCLA